MSRELPSPTPSSPPEETLHFGADDLVEVLVRRIGERLRRDLGPGGWRPGDDPSLVVGIFGEWGSGKTTILEALQERFLDQAAEPSASGQVLTLPVFFNAWRYEAEEHLIIPLLKTAERTLADWPKKVEEPDGRLREAGKWVKQRAVLLGKSAVSLLWGLKGKLVLPGYQLEADVGKSLDELKKVWEELGEAKDESITAELTSRYYDFHETIREITGRGPGAEDEPLNLVFLIDDLDRCLPEKAVQMLESIKLFLAVEGCAFVVAVDDEVVSRGIAHRYRDYAAPRQSGYDSIAYSLRPERFEEFKKSRGPVAREPITGTEYLEKIVHLPVKIPQPRAGDVEAFLQERYPDLFGVPGAARPESRTDSRAGEGRDEEHDDWVQDAEGGEYERGRRQKALERAEKAAESKQQRLLRFFRRCVPAVPRKLVRAAELLSVLLELARRRGWSEIQELTLARLVCLQLFAPELYRFGRKQPAFLAVMERWKENVSEWPLLEPVEQYVNDRIVEAKGTAESEEKTPEETTPKEKESEKQERRQELILLETLEQRLVVRIRQARENRSGFDPLRLVLTDDTADENLHRYYQLFDEQEPERSRDEDTREPAEPADLSAFITQLMSSDPLAWRNAMEQEAEQLQGKVLGPEAFGALLERVRSDPEHVGVAWLRRLEPVLSSQQLEQLVREGGLLRRLADEARGEGDEAIEAARRLRAALEFLCRTINPPHQLDTRRVDLAEFGLPDPDLTGVPLHGAYLRGLAPGKARFSEGALEAAELEGADLGMVEKLDSSLGERTRTLGVDGKQIDQNVENVLLEADERFLAPPPIASRNQISDVATTADGRLLVARESVIEVWDPEAGRLLQILQGHTDWVRSVARLDDQRVLSASDDHTVRVWDLQKPDQPQVLQGHTGSVTSVARLDDQRVLSASSDHTVRVWDLQKPDQTQVLQGHQLPVTSVARLDDRRILSGSHDKTVRVWDLEKPDQPQVLRGHTEVVTFVARLDDQRILSGSYDRSVRIWNLEEPEKSATLRARRLFTSMARLDDQRVLLGSVDHTVLIWDLRHPGPSQVFKGHTDAVTAVARLDDQRVLSTSRDRTVRVWDLQHPDQPQVLQGHTNLVTSVARLTDQRVLSGSADYTVRVWDLQPPDRHQVLHGHQELVASVARLDDRRVLSGSFDHTVRVWDLQHPDHSQVLRGHQGNVWSVARFAEQRVLSGSADRTVRVWDLQHPDQPQVLQGHTDLVRSVARLDDQRVLSASHDNTVRVWNLQNPDQPLVLHGHTDFVTSVARLDDQRVLSASDDHTVRVWDLQHPDQPQVLQGHDGPVYSVARLDDQRVLSASLDGTVRIWNVETGSCERVLMALGFEVSWEADNEKITITHHTRPWKTIRREGRLIPEDPLLHQLSGFVVDNKWAVPVRHFLDLIEIDEENPHRFIQRYPPEWQDNSELIQNFLGRARRDDEA